MKKYVVNDLNLTNTDAALIYSFIEEFKKEPKENGKYYFENSGVYAAVSRYTTKAIENCKYESHKKYCDLQLIVKGREGISVDSVSTPLGEYNEAKDVTLFPEFSGGKQFVLTDGEFLLLFPKDLHRPCERAGEPSEITKIVFKIPVEAAAGIIK